MQLTTVPFLKQRQQKEDRSKMNVCFVMEDQTLEKKFLDFAKENNIYGIKGPSSCWRLSGIALQCIAIKQCTISGGKNEGV